MLLILILLFLKFGVRYNGKIIKTMIKTRYWVVILTLLTLVSASLFACTSTSTPATSSVPIVISPSPTPTNNSTAAKAKISPDDVPRISVDDLKQKIDSGAKLEIIDVRSADDYKIDHIPGSTSVPIDEITNGSWYPIPGPEIILYCT